MTYSLFQQTLRELNLAIISCSPEVKKVKRFVRKRLECMLILYFIPVNFLAVAGSVQFLDCATLEISIVKKLNDIYFL
jgi:hypothetical protein